MVIPRFRNGDQVVKKMSNYTKGTTKAGPPNWWFGIVSSGFPTSILPQTIVYNVVWHAKIIQKEIGSGDGSALCRFEFESFNTPFHSGISTPEAQLEDAQTWIDHQIKVLETARTNLMLLSSQLPELKNAWRITQVPWPDPEKPPE